MFVAFQFLPEDSAYHVSRVGLRDEAAVNAYVARQFAATGQFPLVMARDSAFSFVRHASCADCLSKFVA